MAKKKDHSTEITKVVPELPAHMRGETALGTEVLTEFVVPPRLKIVQALTRPEVREIFSPGTVVLTPALVLIAEYESPFKFVPILFFPEWATWNPIQLRQQLPSIKYRTTDPTDPIVAKSRDPNLREEPHPSDDKYKIRHCEHLNFVCVLREHEHAGMPMIMSFSRGEWITGRNFASLIKMRRAPIFGCIFEAKATERTGRLGNWYGLNVTNPSDGAPWVDDKDEYETLKSLHEEFTEHQKKARLRANLDEDGVEPDAAETAATGEF